MKYVAKQSGTIPTESGEAVLNKGAIVSVLKLNGKLVCNSIVGFFIISPETLGLYFRELSVQGRPANVK